MSSGPPNENFSTDGHKVLDSLPMGPGPTSHMIVLVKLTDHAVQAFKVVAQL